MRHKLEQDSKRFQNLTDYFLPIAVLRLAEICAAIEEMEKRQREAELKRLKAQNQEWIKDFKPEGAAEFGSMPAFK